MEYDMKRINIALSALVLSTFAGNALADQISICPSKAGIKPDPAGQCCTKAP